MKQENNLMPCDQVLVSVLSTQSEELDRKGGWGRNSKKKKKIRKKEYIENNLLTSLPWALTNVVDSNLLGMVGKAHSSIVFEQGLVGKPGFKNVVKLAKKFL